jgi:hypothetical protein
MRFNNRKKFGFNYARIFADNARKPRIGAEKSLNDQI